MECTGDAGQAGGLSYRPSSERSGTLTVGEVQRVHGEPAGDVLLDALPHGEEVLLPWGLGRGHAHQPCALAPGYPPRPCLPCTCGCLTMQMELVL